MSTRTSHLDDVEVDRSFIDGDGKSSIDIYETPEQLGQPDGESSIELPDEYIGVERVLESVENAAGDNTVVYTSEPTHSKLDSAHKQNVKRNVDKPVEAFPTGSVENLSAGKAELGNKESEGEVEKSETPAPKRTATRKAAQKAPEADVTTPVVAPVDEAAAAAKSDDAAK